MKKIPSLGEQEMDLLRHVAERGPLSVREVAQHFEQCRGLARTTVLTVMERLRKKGFLGRSKSEGVFKYSAKIETDDVLSHKVANFVEKTLAGSFRPLVAHFAASSKLSADEMAQLEALAAKLEGKRGEGA